jgi:uncharacterized protein with HEPN domain
LLDIIEAIDRIHQYAPAVDSLKDYAVESVVVRNIQNIGEAANKLSAQFRREQPDVPWSDNISMRHRIVRGYFDVDIEEVKPVLERDLPELRSKIQLILDSGK